MAKITESGLRNLIKQELRKTLNEAMHQPEGLSKLNLFLQKLASMDEELARQLSSVMVKYNVPPTDDVAFGDYHDGGDLEVYTRKGGLIGRIKRETAKNLGIVK
jgi:hypothetical protein